MEYTIVQSASSLPNLRFPLSPGRLIASQRRDRGTMGPSSGGQGETRPARHLSKPSSLVGSPAQPPLYPDRQREMAAQGSVVESGDDIFDDNYATLAIDMKTDGKLGSAFFCSENGSLFLLQEVASADMVWIDQLIFLARPGVVLLPARAPESLVEHLEMLSGLIDQGTYLLLRPRR